MAQINLLKQNTNTQTASQAVPGFVVKFLALVAVGFLGFYGWKFFQFKNNVKKIEKTQAQIAKNNQDALSIKGRDEVFTRQAQLKALNDIVGGHAYFSHLLPELAAATLKKASYTSLRTSPEGVITLNVSVPTLEDLDKFLQVFDVPQYNKNFSDVRIGSFRKIQDGSDISYQFDVKLKFNPEILRYKAEVSQNR